MPYKYGHYFVGVVLLVVLGGFWASYFTLIGHVALAFHVHALTATSWLVLLIAQSVAIHHRQAALHRTVGKASFVMFPLLIAGFVMIINVSAARYAAQEGPFIGLLGPSFGIGMAVAIAAYLTLFYLALRNRRNVRLHAGYMLATPLILFESPFSRLMGAAFPWMNVIGSEGPREVLDTIVISDGLVAVFAMGLYFMNRRNGASWLVVTFFVVLQAVVMWFAPNMPVLGGVFSAYSQLPPALTVSLGLLAGALAGYLGWTGGGAPKRLKAAHAPA
ncbi:hypothetical protein GGQ87_000671 [Brevundimonas alba]|uniref:Uncharacterized protein n=1 Tax=Brevundimonas alba TaxID=74314 RepID=A0A7X5YI76_9CAUL|nr:hypothetical protein [Brevundimonas alba]NJC40413.1 hypothetical protein [Brevundimonas alba]